MSAFSPNFIKMIACQSWFCLSSGPFLTLPLFCSVLLCRGAVLCEAGFPGFQVFRYRSTDGRLQSVEKEKPECFSSSLSAPSSEFQAVAGAALSLQLQLDQIWNGFQLLSASGNHHFLLFLQPGLTELIIYKMKKIMEKIL